MGRHYPGFVIGGSPVMLALEAAIAEKLHGGNFFDRPN